MNGDTKEIVLHVSKQTRNGTAYIHAVPMAVHEGEEHPSNISFDSWRESIGREFADLEMVVYISDFDGRAVVRNPEFRSVFGIDIVRAKSILDTLTKLQRVRLKLDASEAGDIFMALAKVCGATRCCHYPEGRTGAWHSDMTWTFEPIARGREMFRRMIRESEMAHPKFNREVA